METKALGTPSEAQSQREEGGAKRDKLPRKRSKGRIYVNSNTFRFNSNPLEGDPDGYREALRHVDKLSSGRTNSRANERGENRGHSYAQPSGALSPAENGKFSLVYSFEKEKYRTDWGEIWHFLRDMENVKSDPSEESEALPRLCYRNEQTGVTAYFTGYSTSKDSLEAGIEFSLEIPRPQCSAYETLPLAVRVAREFHVNITLRHPDGRLEDVAATSEDLLRCWKSLCAQERQRLKELGKQLPAIRSANLDSVWEHQYLLDELQGANRNNDCVFLGVEYVRRKRTGEVLRMCCWPELVPAVFPPVDLVMLVDVPKPLTQGRIVEASELFSLCREWIKTEQYPIAHKVYSKAEVPAEFMESLAKIKGVTMRSFDRVDWSDLDDI